MMMRMTKAAVAAAALALPFGLADGAAAQQIKLIYSTYLPETYSSVACDAHFMDEVTKATDGRVTFEKYYASSLLNAVDTMPGIGRGAADVGTSFPGGYNRAQYPLSNIVLPFVTENQVAASLALRDLLKEDKEFQSEYEKKNLKLLYSLVPDIHTIWSREPIRTADDLKGKRIRALLAPGDGIKKLGGTPVAMQFPDAIEAMNRGAIDAFANVPFDLGVTAGVHKASKSVTDAGRMGTYAASATAMNLAKWNGLPADVQKAMLAAADSVYDCFFEIVKRDVQKAVDTLGKEKKIEVVTFAPEESQRIRETVGRELWGEWVAWATKEGYDGQRLLDRYLELVAMHEKQHPSKTGFELYKEQYGG